MTVRRASARARNRSTRIDEPTLLQFVLLSMLLHILAIVMFGTTNRGVGRGDEILGTLDVTLRRLAAAPGASIKLAPGSPGALPSPSRSLLPRPESTARIPAPPKPSEQAPVISAPVVPENPQRAAPAATTPEESVPRLNPSAPQEVDKPLRRANPEESAARATIEPSPQPLEPVVPSRIERELSPPIEAPAQAVPTAPALPIERVAPAELERPLAKPVEVPQQAVPAAPATALEPVTPPRSERELAPPVEPLREQPLMPAAPLDRPSAPTIERELSPAIELPTDRTTPERAPARACRRDSGTAPGRSAGRPRSGPAGAVVAAGHRKRPRRAANRRATDGARASAARRVAAFASRCARARRRYFQAAIRPPGRSGHRASHRSRRGEEARGA
jgi:hypothetical protein